MDALGNCPWSPHGFKVALLQIMKSGKGYKEIETEGGEGRAGQGRAGQGREGKGREAR